MKDVAVVTGGAGGMGITVAEIMGRDHSIVICGRDARRLDVARRHLTGRGVDCVALTCDVSSRKSVSDMVDAAMALGTVRSVVHTAGVSPSMTSVDVILRVNAIGTVNVNETFLARADRGFTVVNVASAAAGLIPLGAPVRRTFGSALTDEREFRRRAARICRLVPPRLRSGIAYTVSKDFVRWYCRTQAVRFGRRDARLLSVSPGSIDTDMGRLETEVGSRTLAQTSALRRFGTPAEIAEVLAFCASGKAGYLTGSDVLCDGGSIAAACWTTRVQMARQVLRGRDDRSPAARRR